MTVRGSELHDSTLYVPSIQEEKKLLREVEKPDVPKWSLTVIGVFAFIDTFSVALSKPSRQILS